MKAVELLLTEYILPSEFKFGFELEALGHTNNRFEEFKRFAIRTFGGEFGDDSSIAVDKNTQESFEYKSGVNQFTPMNLQKFVMFLNSLPEYNIVTNPTCSLHIHFSYPTISKEDVFWFLINLATNKEKINEFIKMNKFKFINEKYASLDLFEKIRNMFDDDGIKYINSLLTNEKYSLFRVHPIGTVEWRGPRDFLNKHNQEDIKEFVKKMYSLVKFISSSISNPSVTYNGITLDKKKLYKSVSKNSEDIVFKTSKETRLEQAMKDPRFSFKQNKKILATVKEHFPWFFKGKFSNAIVTIRGDKLYFESGIWKDGVFENTGVFDGGTWKGGEFKGRWIGGYIKSATGSPVYSTEFKKE